MAKTRNDGRVDPGWEENRRRRFRLALDATPAQRLAWLEEALRLARASGARRPLAPPDRF